MESDRLYNVFKNYIRVLESDRLYNLYIVLHFIMIVRYIHIYIYIYILEAPARGARDGAERAADGKQV